MKKLAIIVAAVVLLMNSAPAHAATMDESIESSARKSYVFMTYLVGDDIKIHSKDGIVSLTGTVSEESHKALAQETVAGLPGVKSVDNRLEVRGVPPAANSDAWVRDKVKATLMLHESLNAGNTEVDFKDGIVTLRGNASSHAQKDLTTEYARDVAGVKEVKNEMTVTASKTLKEILRTPGERIDDASITAQVKIVLLFHRSTSALHTRVSTKLGVVTVGGKAINAAERDLVTKLVTDIPGVSSVKNEMTVEEPR
ncbi:MAG: transport-associated protein [Thermodesulfovibrio sp.]|nr:transport-associated protein [Thermodesulfovibrio sp.]